MVEAGIIVPVPFTAAQVAALSGWSRETKLDGKYIRGADTSSDADLDTVFGNAAHSHTSPEHTPIQDAHTHTFSSGTVSASLKGGNITPVTQKIGGHSHGDKTSTSATATNQAVAITIDETTNDLDFVEVIFIKSDGTAIGIPDGGYGFFDADTFPANWDRVQGNKYLKGAATNADGGGLGGSNTHTHTSPAHNHPQNGHAHPNNVSTASGGSNATIGGNAVAKGAHTHGVDLDSAIATNQDVTTTLSSDNHEPPYKKLNIIANGTGVDDLPDEIIELYGGSEASIPENWSRFSGMDGLFVKGANADGQSNIDTGGSDTHGHTADDCQPLQDGHYHTGTQTSNGASTFVTLTGFANNSANAAHVHTWSSSSDVATNQAIGVSIDDCDAEAAYPLYQKLIFVKYTKPLAAATKPLRALLGAGV